ncbi:MAG: response regulator transcription factor [Crocinitomicaceae bacterium]|nr:response regulator transcription factor [Crocinitomicaceae bacterium]
MSKISVVVVEDSAEDAQIVSDTLADAGYELIGVAKNLQEARVLVQKAPDLVILDIHLGSTMDGITFGHELHQSTERKIPFIFLTSAIDKATFAAAKASYPKGYLIKPFNPLELDYAIELAIESCAENAERFAKEEGMRINEFFYLKHNRTLVKLSIKEISHIKVDGRYSELYHDGNRYLCRKSLKDLQSIFPEGLFVRTHRNFLGNAQFIRQVIVGESSVYLTNDEILPLSAGYIDEVKSVFPVLG